MRIQLAFAMAVALAACAQAQPGCPAVAFKTAVSANLQPSAASHIVLLRENDGSYTAYEMTNESPYRIVRKTPNYQKQLTACLPSHSSLPPLLPPTAPGSPPGAPSQREAFVRLGSGDYLFVTAGIDVVLFDSELNFKSEAQYPQFEAQSLTLADFNGDGNLDIVAIRAQPIGISESPLPAVVDILLGTGGVGFQKPTEYQIPASGYQSAFPISVAVGDLNGDHKPDLVVVTGSFPLAAESTMWIFFGDGNGTFQAQEISPLNLNVPGQISAIAIADLNRDGRADLAFTFLDGSGNPMLAVALGNGNATFSTPALYPVQGFQSLAVGDVNGDGIPDIVTSGVSILFGDGKGAFLRRLDYLVNSDGAVILADIDGDGRMDIVLGEGNPLALTAGLMVLFGWDNGTYFGPQISLVPGAIVPQAYGLAAADFNGDGIQDLVYWWGAFSILKGTGDGSFIAGAQYQLAGNSYALALAVADLNHDGKPDFAVTTANPASVAVFLGKGDGTFEAPLNTSAPAGLGKLVAGDFNGDGKLDLAVIESTANSGLADAVLIFLGHGDGTFASPVAYPAGPVASSIAVGDFNGDGKLDLAITNAGSQIDPQTGGVSLLLGKGDGTFSAGTSITLRFAIAAFPAFGGPDRLVVADFNRDGKLDLAITSDEIAELAILLGRGDGSFQAPAIYPIDARNVMAVADLNGDKIPDLIVSGEVTGYLLGNGDGTFQPGVSVTSQTGPLITADFNGDGKSDLALPGVVTFLNISQPPPSLTVVSSASLAPGPVAPDSFATAFGKNSAAATASAGSGPWPTTLSNTTASVRDASGNTRPAQLLYVSPQQVNFLIPADTSAGMATVTVTTQSLGLNITESAQVQIAPVAPSLFVLNAGGLAAAYLVRVAPGKPQSFDSVFTLQNGALVAKPIDLGPPGEQVYLILYGTGIRNVGPAGVTVNIDGLNARVTYAGPETKVDGLDQINVLLPPALAGSGDVSVVLTAAGIAANSVRVTIQ